jgi:3-phosphoshikimate 1-carboxyvinyltransferase
MLAALAPGRSVLRGALSSDDAQSTARVLRQLGATISPLTDAGVTVDGSARWIAPDDVLDCGNSGTTVRLLLGLLAAHDFAATVTGDPSLRRRPMRRVSEPLRAMGAVVDEAAHDGLPLTMHGGALRALQWTLPVPSAQLKSALLLAGAAAGVDVDLREPGASRDHTERMLRQFGFAVESGHGRVSLRPTGTLHPFEIDIPGDASSAIFLLAAAALAGAGTVTLADVGLNPSRIAYLMVLRQMGLAIDVRAGGEHFGEPRGTMSTGPAALRAVEVPARDVPAMIDEIPMLACLAARAAGTSTFDGLAELRVKESDRLTLLAANLNRVGVAARVDHDDLTVVGTSAPLRGAVVTGGDHRMAMAFAVLGTLPDAGIQVDDPTCASVSFPGFATALANVFEPSS